MWSEVIMYMPATEIAMAESRDYFRDMEKEKAKLSELRGRFKYYVNLFDELKN